MIFRIRLVYVAICLCMFGGGDLVSAGVPAETDTAATEFELGPAASAYRIPRHIAYSFTVSNTKNEPSRDVEFLAYAPVRQTAVQQCVRLSTSQPATLESDIRGNQILRFQIPEIAPHGVVLVRVKADLMMAGKPQSMNTEDVELYTGPVESEAAEELQKVSTTLKHQAARDTAQSVQQWIAENMHNAGYVHARRGPAYAIENLSGDCTEYADLFTALCRSADVPARTVGGYMCGRDQILKPQLFHNWSEFHDGQVWRLADPLKRTFDKSQNVYIAMNIMADMGEDDALDGYPRLRVIGKNIKARMNN